MSRKTKILNSIIVFGISFALMCIVQIKVSTTMLIAERFAENLGWGQIFAMAIFGGFLYYKMSTISNTKKWRTISWTLFSVVFFLQLALGLFGFEDFLMTGKLHFPIPAVIPGVSIFRMEFGFMPILFTITVLLTGPAWCSQLCYFGALDNLSASIKTKKHKSKKHNLMLIKNVALLVFIVSVVALRIFDLPLNTIVIIASSFGIIGVFVVVIFSHKRGKMTHCIYYCPLGTILNYSRFINPFRMYIDDNCTNCMTCTSSCKYQALEKENILKRKQRITCKMCGDFIDTFPTSSIKYKFFKLSPEKARTLYLIITISVYVVFLNVARI